MTAIDTSPVTMRFTNSIQPCAPTSAVGARLPLVQFGQSGQPSPEPVRRTAAPVTMIEAEQDRGDDRDPSVLLGRERRPAHGPSMVRAERVP